MPRTFSLCLLLLYLARKGLGYYVLAFHIAQCVPSAIGASRCGNNNSGWSLIGAISAPKYDKAAIEKAQSVPRYIAAIFAVKNIGQSGGSCARYNTRTTFERDVGRTCDIENALRLKTR